jgi:hypothetical protein
MTLWVAGWKARRQADKADQDQCGRATEIPTMRVTLLKIILFSVLCGLLCASCSDAPRRRGSVVRGGGGGGTSSDSGMNAMSDASQNIGIDVQGQLPDLGNAGFNDGGNTSLPAPDAGQQATDCNHNPNQCGAHQLMGEPPNCFCRSECETGWMWDNQTRSCVEECATNIVNLYNGQPCAAATLSCLEACYDAACQYMCLMNDPNPTNCLECLQQNTISCVNQNGCQSDWDLFNCCIERNCPQDPSSCSETTCNSQNQSHQQCLNGTANQCGPQQIACFMN